MSMKQPPSGTPVEGHRDPNIEKQLSEMKRCMQVLVTDGGKHYIYCGGYFHGKTTKTKHGWRCKFHK